MNWGPYIYLHIVGFIHTPHESYTCEFFHRFQCLSDTNLLFPRVSAVHLVNKLFIWPSKLRINLTISTVRFQIINLFWTKYHISFKIIAIFAACRNMINLSKKIKWENCIFFLLVFDENVPLPSSSTSPWSPPKFQGRQKAMGNSKPTMASVEILIIAVN